MILAALTRSRLEAEPDLKAALLELNNLNAEALSWLDEARFLRLVDEAFLALATPEGDALLITFRQAADYDSPNFAWFKARFDRFVYVDRIVISESGRGKGLARAAYKHLFEAAKAGGHTRITCEVNADPPNPVSDAFHAAMGFANIGEAMLDNGKTVRYFERLIG